MRALAITLLSLLAGAAAASADPLKFTISPLPAPRLGSLAPLEPIAPGFVGASIDYCSMTEYATSPGADAVLVNLLRGISPSGVLLRVGGNGPDGACGHRPFHRAGRAVAVVRTIARRLSARLILGVDLEAHELTRLRSEVRTLLAGLDPRQPRRSIAAFEIGNEPDLDPRYGPNVAAARTGPYFRRYMRDFSRWTRAIRTVAKDPAFPVAGPSLGRFGFPWITGPLAGDFRRFEDGPARPAILTFHSYPLFGKGDICPNVDCPSLQNLLLDSSSRGMAAGLAPFAAQLRPGRELRVDEANSITSGGTPGVSDTFSSALWALDMTFEIAHAGAAGINFHTFSSAGYALFSHPFPRRWLVHPEYYGLLMFARAAPAGSRLLHVAPTHPPDGGPNVKVWATRSAAGRLRIVVINKDPVPHQVVLDGAALPRSRPASAELLQGPPATAATGCPAGYEASGLCATSGIRLAGRTFGAPGATGSGDSTLTGTIQAPASRCAAPLPARCLIRLYPSGTPLVVPAGSAILLVSRFARRRDGLR